MTTDEMRSMKGRGMSFRAIARAAGVSHQAVYYALGGLRAAPRSGANDNDSRPGRVTAMVPRNGGCSTTSGMVPVTIATSVPA